MMPDAAISSPDTIEIVIVMEDNLAEVPRGTIRVAPVGVREALPLAMAMVQANQFADIALLDANYLRVPDAELALRARTLALANAASAER